MSKIVYSRLYEQVIDYIDHMVESGELKFGDKLPSERVFSETLGVSRGTIRDAFRILESQGVIETKPGGRRRLTNIVDSTIFPEESAIDRLRKSAILDMLEVREILEVASMALVCARATDEEILELEKMFETSNDGKDDYLFHYKLAELSANRVLMKFMKINFELMAKARELNFVNRENHQISNEEHRDILRAIKQRDSAAAQLAMKTHMENIRQRLGQRLT